MLCFTCSYNPLNKTVPVLGQSTNSRKQTKVDHVSSKLLGCFDMAEQEDQERAEFFREIDEYEPGTFVEGEQWWTDHYQWLYDSGYKLRDRYKPGWTPSWHKNGKRFYQCVDGYANRVSHSCRKLEELSFFPPLVGSNHRRYPLIGRTNGGPEKDF